MLVSMRRETGERAIAALLGLLVVLAALVGLPAAPAGAAGTAHVTGTVTAASGPVSGASVYLYSYGTDEDICSYVTQTTTDAAGHYDAGALNAGSYRVQVTATGYAPQFWNGAGTCHASTAVVVAAGATVAGVNAVLAPTAHLKGTITGPGGLLIDHVQVTAYLLIPGTTRWESAGTAVSASNGTYDVQGIGAGTYRLDFDPNSPFFAQEYYHDEALFEDADSVVVTAGQTLTGLDGQVSASSHVVGTVTGTGGAPLAGVSVKAYRYAPSTESWAPVAASFTDAAGHYDIGRLSAGTYRLGFHPDAGYLDEYWDDRASVELADDVVVPDGDSVTRDAQLSASSRVKGVVTGPGGAPVAGAQVSLYRFDAGAGDYVVTAVAFTDGTGAYDLAGLAPGTYRLGFADLSGALAPEFWNDKPTVAAADPVTVGTGVVLTGRSAQLAATSHLKGKVTGPTGTALSAADVTAYRYDDTLLSWRPVAYASTDASGNYDLAGLGAGSYRIGFSHSSGTYVAEFYNDKASVALADTVVVAAAASLTGLNASLATSSHVTGRVTSSATAANLAGVIVTAYAFDTATQTWQPVANTATAADGTFDVASLRAGTYRLGYADPGGTYATEFWNDKTTVLSATDVVVAAATTVTGRNAALATAGHVTGTVTRTGGAPLAQVHVTAYSLDATSQTWVAVGTDDTSSIGYYDVGALPAGTYRLGFVAAAGGFVTEYWDDKATLAAAADVTVAAGAVLTGRNAVLAKPPAPPVVNVSVPVVTGTAKVGQLLSTSTGTWNPADATTAVQWVVGGVDVVGATVATYTPVAGDVGKTVTVRVTASRSGYASASAVSAATAAVVPGTIANVTVPTISGTAKVGQVLTASPGTWNPSDAATAFQWVVGGVDVAGATAATYTPVAGDVGKAVTVRVAASKSGYTTVSSTSTATAAVVPGTITNVTVPTISGTAKVGQVLTAGAGTWNPSDAATALQWVVGGVDVVGATAATYTPVAGDVGKAVTVRVTASKSGYTTVTAVSAATSAVALGTIANLTAPTVTGTPALGQALTATAGTWSPSDATTSLQWVVGGVDVAGATTATYTPVVADVGKTVTVRVSAAKPGYAGASATSVATAAVAPGAMTNLTPPAISGTAKVGQVLTATPGTWSQGGVTTAFQWVVAGSDVAGATGSTYSPVAGDVGKVVTVRVTASKTGYADASASSAATAAVVVGTIANVTVPAVTGTPKVGQVLTATAGTWNPSDAGRAFQWVVGGVDAAGATTATYTPVAADVGKAVSVRVTASKAGYADASVGSAATAVVAAGTLVNVTVPTVSGTAKVGQVLTATAGTWNPSGVTAAYQWVVAGTDVSGATGSTYTPVAGDVGKAVTVRVTASRAGYADASATSAATAGVAVGTIVNLTAPAVTGTAALGQVLTATAGTWNPSGVTTAYQWVVGGTDVAGATAATYSPVAGDVGKTVTVRVTASRAGYADASATSAATAAVVAGTIVNLTPPAVTGTAKVGQVLTATAGTWSQAGVSTAFQWVVAGSDVAGATGSTYTPVAGDVGKVVAVRVTASKAGYADASATSAATAAVVVGTLTNLTVPTVTGTPKVGQVLTATAGTWNPSGVTAAYQWVVAGADVAGATGSTYTPVAADVGKTVSVRVTASRAGYADASASSVATAAVATGTIASVAAPTTTGTPKVGQVLTASAGTWNPSSVTAAYQWVVAGTDVSGATSSTYTPVAGDVGKTVTVRVTASKAGYADASATSAATAAVVVGTITGVTAPAITGTAALGQVLTASAGTWNPSGVTAAHQWVVGGTDVAGATGPTYTPVAGDVGSVVTVRVTVSRAGYADASATSAATAAVVGGTLSNLTPPTVSGTPKVGQVLTATAGTWSQAGVTTTYQWVAGGADVSGATASTYTPVAGDVGKTLAVRVSATKPGYGSASASSAATAAVAAGTIVNLTAPTVTGTAKVGQVLTAGSGTWNPADATLAHQWVVAGIDVAGATASTYTPVAGDVGKTVAVRVTASKPGYTTLSLTSAVTAAVVQGTIANLTPPSITGTAKVGQVLTATAGTWNPGAVTAAYQWVVAGTDVAGATTSTYTPVAGDVGKAVTVRVTASKAGYADASVSSSATAAVGPGTITNLTPPTVAGTPALGQVLTATAGTWSPGSVTTALQWVVGGVDVAGATASTYTPVAGDVGKTVTMRVTASRAGYTTVSLASAPTAVVAPGTMVNLTLPAVSGVPGVGQVLTATAGTWNPAGASTAYQWLAGGSAIAGATGSTYTPVAGDVGKTVTVRVTASKSGYSDATATSAPTGAVTSATAAPQPPPAVVRNVVKPVVAGTAVVGRKLKVSTGSWDPGAVSLRYQWLAGGKVIKGATRRTLKLTKAQLGKKITVRVTATATGLTATTVTTRATRKVKAPQPSPRRTVVERPGVAGHLPGDS